ncbi:DUF2971 domain-containing protein [Kocuria oceani]|uniref:DUF2971 domain-containing protein n=1 Tax=Kocuria oceani TaxID=988827 RepID=UPI0040359826
MSNVEDETKFTQEFVKSLEPFVSAAGSFTGDTLYHYTNTEGLMGIVGNKEIWATDVRYLNDKSELMVMLDFMQQRWGEKIESIEIAEMITPLKQAIFSSRESSVFVSCFCEEGDLLSQWRGYGSPGGYSLGFDYQSLAMQWASASQQTLVLPVSYDANAAQASAERMADLAIDKWNDTYPTGMLGFVQSVLKDDYFDGQPIHEALRENIMEDVAHFGPEEAQSRLTESSFGNALYAALQSPKVVDKVASTLWWFNRRAFSFAPLVASWHKDPAFQEEKEWRMAIQKNVQDLEREGQLNFRSSTFGLTPFIKAAYTSTAAPFPLKEVIVGPGNHADLRKASVEMFLSSQGLASQVEVKLSEIPFRS